MSEILTDVRSRIKTQDNRITQNPMFCVQEKVRVVGMDAACSDNTVWVDTTSGDYEESDTEQKGYEEFGVYEYWKTVMVAFTEDGCKEYLRLNGHNHRGETRIYVESFNRCPEMIAIRESLLKS